MFCTLKTAIAIFSQKICFSKVGGKCGKPENLMVFKPLYGGFKEVARRFGI